MSTQNIQAVAAALEAAVTLRIALQHAHANADAVASLLLIPMVGEANAVAERLAALHLALKPSQPAQPAEAFANIVPCDTF